MSVSIKLAMFGSVHNPFYRIVAAPTRSKRDGKNLGVIGWYNLKQGTSKVNKKEFDAWIKKGAIVTEGVKKIL